MTDSPTFRVIDLIGVEVELPDQFPMVTLQEAEEPLRSLTFRIGMPEGVALANLRRGLDTPRPMVHELFSSVLRRANIDVVSVRLVGRVGETYEGELQLMTTTGQEVLPCRPSDGLLLALRQIVPAPILADERLFLHDGDVMPRVPTSPEAAG